MLDRLKRMLGFGRNGQGEMISCDETRQRLFEYLDQELDTISAEEVQKHLDACPECWPRAAFEKCFLDSVQKVATGEVAPPELKERILLALADEAETE